MNRDLLSFSLAAKGDLLGKNVLVANNVINSQQASIGDLFFAIKGENSDGHDYVLDAIDRGAIGAVVTHDQKVPVPYIKVSCVKKAIADIATEWRKNFNIPCIGVTGSNGKTTVKEFTTHILSQKYSVHSSKGNQNNELGLPLSVMALKGNIECAVFEMGARNIGDIKYLMGIAAPSIGIITNAHYAHISEFGNLKEIVTAKGEMVGQLPRNGVAILNKDDPYYQHWSSINTSHNEINFSMTQDADIKLIGIKKLDSKSYKLNISCKGNGLIEVNYKTISMHNIQNLLPAIAVGIKLEVPLEDITYAISTMPELDQRMALKPHPDGYLVIDDTYNANPASTLSALNSLSAISKGKRIFIFGGMEELGSLSTELHSDIGRHACSTVDIMIVLPGKAELALDEYKGQKIVAKDYKDAINTARLMIDSKSTILIKGSRNAKMERIVLSLMQRSPYKNVIKPI
jgi:UDP-N-acetylmuramoyl-tripeptide--D-alanyl-D-alanine ligase